MAQAEQGGRENPIVCAEAFIGPAMSPQEEVAAMGDIPLEVEVELDRRVVSTREVLELEVGSVIGTTRSAGENIDIYISGVLCGSGEIVVIENTLGVRITDFRGD